MRKPSILRGWLFCTHQYCVFLSFKEHGIIFSARFSFLNMSFLLRILNITFWLTKYVFSFLQCIIFELNGGKCISIDLWQPSIINPVYFTLFFTQRFAQPNLQLQPRMCMRPRLQPCMWFRWHHLCVPVSRGLPVCRDDEKGEWGKYHGM